MTTAEHFAELRQLVKRYVEDSVLTNFDARNKVGESAIHTIAAIEVHVAELEKKLADSERARVAAVEQWGSIAHKLADAEARLARARASATSMVP